MWRLEIDMERSSFSTGVHQWRDRGEEVCIKKFKAEDVVGSNKGKK